MDKKNGEKKITLTEEQATRAAETLLNAWLRGDDNTTPSNKVLKANINNK
ncbi:hypothetical protein [Clostridium sp.]|nr:hypothetical protein [Clostridium sp.]